MGRSSIRKKIKICVIGSSRATYGYKKNILKILNKDKAFDLKFIVTGMHLSKKHGYSVQDIIKDKIPIYKKINTNFKTDNEKITVEIAKGVNVVIIRSTVADVIKKS